MNSYQAWRALPALLLLLTLAFTLTVLPTAAEEDEGGVLAVDTPSDAQTLELGQLVVFEGWAVNWAGPGTGVDGVVVLDAPLEAGGRVVALAAYGGLRLDVAAEYGEEWAYSAFQAAWAAAGSTGDRTFWIYAHSVTDDSWANKAVTIHITEPLVAGAPAAAPAAPAAAQDRPASRAPNSSTNAAGQVRNPVTGLFETPNANQQGTTSGNQYSGQNISPYAAFGPYGQCGNHFNALSSPYSSQFGAPDPHNGYNNMLCGPSSQGGNQGPYYQAGVQTPYTQVGNQAPYNQVGYQTPTNQVGNQVSYNQAPYGGASCTPGQYGQQPSAYGSSTGGYGTGSGCQAYPTASVASGPTVTATAGADGTVTLTWAAVASATQYRVYRVSPSTSLLSTLQPSAGGATMGTVITGQAPGSAATFQVRAVSANGVETAVAASSVGSGSPALVAPQGTAR